MAILLSSMLLGPLFDLFDVFDGALSGTAVGAGLTLFGASGVLVLGSSGPVWLAYTLAGALGAASLAAVGAMTSRLQKASVQIQHEVIGLTGVAASPITGAMGEVQLSHPREINKRMAFCEGVIAAGAPVTVVEVHGSRVKVAKTPA